MVMILPKCETCRYWERSDSTGKEEYGICRRFPPTLFVDEEDEITSYWPSVPIPNYCGEHAPRHIG